MVTGYVCEYVYICVFSVYDVLLLKNNADVLLPLADVSKLTTKVLSNGIHIHLHQHEHTHAHSHAHDHFHQYGVTPVKKNNVENKGRVCLSDVKFTSAAE